MTGKSAVRRLAPGLAALAFVVPPCLASADPPRAAVEVEVEQAILTLRGRGFRGDAP
jgi:hypothetical protein